MTTTKELIGFVRILMLVVIIHHGHLIAQNLSALQVNLGQTPSATLPLDVALKHRISVRNSGSTSLVIDVRTRVIETNQEAPIFPQPPTLYLAPSEEVIITLILDGETGRLSQLPVGQNSRRVSLTFFNRQNVLDTLVATATYSILALDRTRITGSFQVRGTVVDQSGAPVANAQINLETGTDFSLPNGTANDGSFFFSIPRHSKWMLKASKQGYRDAYAFIDTASDAPYQLRLFPSQNQIAQYQQVQAINTDIGFWQGDVTKDEQSILLAQGMEIWPNESLRAQSKLFSYRLDGTKVWEYNMGHDAWGVSVSRDGRYAAYAQKHSTNPELGLLDASTGNLIWKLPLSIQNFPTGSSFNGHSSNEVRISNNNQFIGVGTGEGDYYLLNRSDGQIRWRKFLRGQVRNTRFSSDDQYVYVGSDPWLYKFRVADSSQVWRANISSWPLHYGLRLSPDESLIASMVKSGEVTVIRTADGSRAWSYDQGVVGQWLDFSPDGRRLVAAAFGGTWIYDVTTGKPLWRGPGTKAGYFSADNKYLLLNNQLYTQDGTLLLILPQQIGTQVAFISKDNTRIVLAAGQMNAPGLGIVFYQGSVVSSVQPEESIAPLRFGLEQNFPNPFNSSTNFRIRIERESFVSLKVLDLLGRHVATLIDGRSPAGTFLVSWDATNLASGIYFHRLEAGAFSETRKLLLIR